MRMRLSRALLIGVGMWIGAISVLHPGFVHAHPGNTDSRGGHTCRTNCERWGLSYGQYHYHGTRSTSSSVMRATSPLPPPRPKPDNTWKWVLGIGAGVAALYWLGNRPSGPKK